MSRTTWRLARCLGILDSYTDQAHRRRRMTAATRDALILAFGIDPDNADEVGERLRALTSPRALPRYFVAEAHADVGLSLTGPWILTDEAGQENEGQGPLPPLPVGYFSLRAGGETCQILSAPTTLPLPPPGWGVTGPLYGLRGQSTGGLGSYGDLGAAVRALGQAGAGFFGINPIHAGFPGDPDAISPYSPSHRRRLATDYLSFGPESEQPGDLIDYPATRALRRRAAESAYAADRDPTGFAAFLAREGPALTRFATYEALAETLGPYWNSWPDAEKNPQSAGVARFATDNADRIRFHQWLQFQCERQLGSAAKAADVAGMRHGLYLDLAVGTHPYGAETWAERQSFAFGVSLGAPPDAFSPEGQRWTLAPFNPSALIDQGFQPLAATLRAQLRYARLLRIDHILGFERAFWVPEDGAPGGYVRMPRDAMLAVVRIEAIRAGATIVGEDLGNIPAGLRKALAASGILGCRVAMFEGGRAAEGYAAAALASFGTHDLPTWLGWREGRDITLRREIGGVDRAAEAAARKDRQRDVAALDAALDASAPDVDDLHRFLARTPSRLVAVQLEDVLGQMDQPNLPGTTTQYPNWRRALPVSAKDLLENQSFAMTSETMSAVGR